MFNKYYQDELTYLRDLGREFAAAYPGIAPMLAERGGDPDVERLLEGVAFLTGKIRQKLDDELPEVIHSVASPLTSWLNNCRKPSVAPVDVDRDRRPKRTSTEHVKLPTISSPFSVA